jgi:hypothetical protein
MAFLNRNAILAASDIVTESVEVPEWGGTVLVRSLTGEQRDRFEASMVGLRKGKQVMKLNNVRAQLVALSVVDESGQLLFSEHDIVALGEKSCAALQRIWDVARKLSGLSDDDVEELTKNSESDQSDDSTSA